MEERQDHSPNPHNYSICHQTREDGNIHGGQTLHFGNVKSSGEDQQSLSQSAIVPWK